MSLIRPEAATRIWRWREVAFTGVIILFGVRLIGNGFALKSITMTGLGVLIVGVFSYLLFHAILRAKFNYSAPAAGVVEIKEREVGYLGPDAGSFVSLDDLTKLEIIKSKKDRAQEDVYWLLTHLGGDALVIPASAVGSDKLIDAFSALSGFKVEDAFRAMNSHETTRSVIWEKAVH